MTILVTLTGGNNGKLVSSTTMKCSCQIAHFWAYTATTLVKSLRRAILQAAEKRAYFHGCSDVCKGFVKSWEKLPTEPRRSGGEWESVYRRKKMKSEHKCYSPLFNVSNKLDDSANTSVHLPKLACTRACSTQWHICTVCYSFHMRCIEIKTSPVTSFLFDILLCIYSRTG